MFAPKKKVQKATAELAAKKKSAAINIGKIGGMKKPIADNTYVKGPVAMKNKAQASKSSFQEMKRRMEDVIRNPEKSSSDARGFKVYEKGSMVVRLTPAQAAQYKSKQTKKK
jgi:hypothetical protein